MDLLGPHGPLGWLTVNSALRLVALLLMVWFVIRVLMFIGRMIGAAFEDDGAVSVTVIPVAPAYLIWHDGSRMVIWARKSLAEAQAQLQHGEKLREKFPSSGHWEVCETLPRKGKVREFYPLQGQANPVKRNY